MHSVDSAESRENKKYPVPKYFLQWVWNPDTSAIPAMRAPP